MNPSFPEPPRPRGRAVRPATPARDGGLLLSTVDIALLRLSQHDTVLVSATDRPTLLRTRHVFRAR